MHSKCLLLLCLHLALQASLVVAKSQSTLLDAVENVDLKAVAQAVCSDQANVEISRLATLSKLSDFLDSKSSFKCSQQVVEMLATLRMIVELGQEDVCGQEHIEYMENFHSMYSSSGQTSSSRILELFFRRYAIEVSTICKKNLMEILQTESLVEFEATELSGTLGLTINRISDMIAQNMEPIRADNDFDDVYLIWDFLNDNFIFENLDALWKYVNPVGISEDGQAQGLNLKVTDATQVEYLQEYCRKRFKPVYSRLVFPILKLSSLGYSAKFGLLGNKLDKFRKSEKVKRWFTITQACEFILPIRVFSDNTVKYDSVVILEKSQAGKIGNQVATKINLPAFNFASPINVIEFDQLPGINIDKHKVDESIKSCLKIRRDLYKVLVSRLSQRIKQVSSGIGTKILFSSGDSDYAAKLPGENSKPASRKKPANSKRINSGQQNGIQLAKGALRKVISDSLGRTEVDPVIVLAPVVMILVQVAQYLHLDLVKKSA